MIVLDDTTGKIQVVLAASVAASQLEYYTSYRDITTTAYTPGKSSGLSNNTTDVDIVAAPAASTQRVIDFLSVYNADTAAATVTIKHDTSGTERRLWKGYLSAGYLVTYCEGVGWKKYNARGEEVVDTGAVIMFGGSVTLGTSVTTTTITDARIVGGGKSRVVCFPKTANAAGATLVLYVSAIADGSATLTHNSSALADRTFDYEIFVQ